MVKQGTSKVKFMLGTSKIKAFMLGTEKVWSSGSVVSYYDGDTLLGTEEFEEGLDVLHPSIDTSKEGYTLYGWGTTTDIESKVGYLVATGEPITLYALYLPNSLTVALASLGSSQGWVRYTLTLLNSQYVSGGIQATASGYNTWGGGDDQPKESGTSFNLDLGLYGSATITVQFTTANGRNFSSKFDGASVASGETKTVTVSASGNHTLWAKGYAWYQSWCSCVIAVTSIVLTNPQAWV